MGDVTRPQLLGCLIHDLRTTLGYSQSRLAAELVRLGHVDTVTAQTIYRWECGRRTPRAYSLRYLAAALDVPLAVLEDAAMDRRQFITTLAGTAIAPVAAADLIRSGFAAALSASPTVDHWLDTLVRYGRDYMALGAAEIQQRLARDLVVLQQQLDAPELWGVASRLMTLYGKTIPGSDGARAISWYRMAAEAADRSGDAGTRVWVRGRAAIALGYEGASLPVADMFAGQALAISDAPSLGRLNAIMGRAHSAALRGDVETARRLLDEGRRTFDVAGSYEQTSDYAVPEWRMGVFTSLLAARLGDERTALDAQDAALATLPESLPRFRTHLELHRGLMMARSGDRSGGIAYAHRAMHELPPEKHSLTLRLLVKEIERPAA